MLPVCRSDDEGFAIPTFDLVPSDVEGFLEKLWELQSAFHDCFAHSEPRAHFGSVHMTQDICGKKVLPTSPSAWTYKATKAEVPNPANVSCSPLDIIRCVRRCKARCWTLIQCASSSSISSS